MDNKKKKMAAFGGFSGILLVVLVVALVLVLTQQPQSVGTDGTTTTVNTTASIESQNSTTATQSNDTSANATTSSNATSGSTANQPNSDGNTTTTVTSAQSTTTTKTTSTEKEPNMNTQPQVIDTTKYNLYTYTQRYWSGNTVYNESVYPMTTKTGENEVIQLLYPATKIIEVRSSDLKTLYKEGKDYTLVDGKLVIPSGSSIRVNDYNKYYLTEELPGQSMKAPNNGYIYFSEGAVFHNAQIAVTYQHSSKWSGPVPAKQGSELPKLQERIAEKSALTVVFFGDSISCGANASSTVGASPYTPKWTEMFEEYLEQQGVVVTAYNTSVGGQVSSYGALYTRQKVTRYNPDLVVLGWGMNDASSWNNTSIQQYYENMKAMIIQIRNANPNCEIILLGSMFPNSEAIEFVGPIEEYTDELKKLANEYDGVVLANMSEIHKHILTRKNYRDITGNNVNHPNDFVSRMYTQVLLETISK